MYAFGYARQGSHPCLSLPKPLYSTRDTNIVGPLVESFLSHYRGKKILSPPISVSRDSGRWWRATAHPPSRRSRRRIQPEFGAAHPAGFEGANQAGGTYPAGVRGNASSQRRRRQTQPEFAVAHPAEVDGGETSRRRWCTHPTEGRSGTAT
jgi:hypothetical protein